MHPPFRSRPARPTDHALFAAFLVELHTDDPVPAPERWEREMMPSTFFLEDVADADRERANATRTGNFPAGPTVGYAFVEEYGERGYVRHVVVHPAHRGRGVGRALMHEIAARLRHAGARRWELNVKRDNVPAIRLYESCGMREQYSTHVMRLDWADTSRLPSVSDVVRPRGAIVTPEEDARIEGAFGLPTGQVARLREAPGDVLIGLTDPRGEPVGFARFNPSFPGCFPFRVRRPELARVILDALRPHARHEHAWLQLVVEDDAATSSALFEAGARPVFEILHLHGDLPAAPRPDATFRS